MGNMKTKKKVKDSKKIEASIHPWRLCPYGQHWVRTHPLQVPASKKDPDGHMTTRHEHCAHNPSGKDQIYPDEIKEISDKNFSNLKEQPCPLNLGFGESGTKYDNDIAGWTKYWNDVLKPDIPLDPNVVKALIASESGFDPKALADKKDLNSARGLMQITNEARKILGDENGEIKDHYVTVTREELNDPSINICAGIRWIFQKKSLASALMGRTATWDDAIREYKGARTVSKDRANKIMEKLYEKLEFLKVCGKK